MGGLTEHQGEQLFRQRLPARENIGGTVQVDRLILPLFYTYLEKHFCCELL